MTPRERAYQLRDALRAREIALDVTAVNAVEAAILADRAERDAVRESADVAYERALAEQAAGEAERVREAVAREREACAVLCETWTNVYPGASYARGCAARIRARATSPAPCVCGCPASEHDARNVVGEIERDCAAHGCERYYDSTCTLGEPAPEPVAAERAVIEAAQFGASWYAYDPETGYDTFETAEEAQRAAEASLDHYRDGSPDGWHESVGEIEWGLLVPYGEARQCDVVNAEDDPTVAANGWDYRCDYRLHSVRSAAVDALAAARKGGG